MILRFHLAWDRGHISAAASLEAIVTATNFTSGSQPSDQVELIWATTAKRLLVPELISLYSLNRFWIKKAALPFLLHNYGNLQEFLNSTESQLVHKQGVLVIPNSVFQKWFLSNPILPTPREIPLFPLTSHHSVFWKMEMWTQKGTSNTRLVQVGFYSYLRDSLQQ